MAGFLTGIFSRLTGNKSQPSTSGRTIYYGGGVSVTGESAMKVAALYRGLIYISSSIAKLPWEVKDADNTILYKDPVHRLLSIAPNEEMTAMEFRLLAIQTAIMKGNFYAEIERDLQGRVTALWPLETANVTPVRGTDGRLLYRVTGDNAPDGEIFFRPRDIFHLKNLHLSKDGLTGLSLIEYAGKAIGISQAADDMASALFLNGGIPSGVLTHQGIMDDAAYERLKKSWKEGAKASVRILEEGVKYEAIDVDPQVLQFLESRKFGVVEIARFLGLPPTKLFDMAASTFNNVENANLEVGTDTIAAWVANLESVADVKLLTNNFSGRYTEIDMREMTRGDMNTRSNYYTKMMQTASLTPNEIRKLEGYAPYTEGNEFMLATNNYTPMSRVNDVIDATIAGKDKTNTSSNPPPSDQATDLTNAAIRYLERK